MPKPTAIERGIEQEEAALGLEAGELNLELEVELELELEWLEEEEQETSRSSTIAAGFEIPTLNW